MKKHQQIGDRMKQDAKHALLIYNPYSGKKRRHRQFPLLRNKLINLGYKIELHKTTDQMEIETKIRKACAEKWDAIFTIMPPSRMCAYNVVISSSCLMAITFP